jgi:hypothetical protein
MQTTVPAYLLYTLQVYIDDTSCRTLHTYVRRGTHLVLVTSLLIYTDQTLLPVSPAGTAAELVLARARTGIDAEQIDARSVYHMY